MQFLNNLFKVGRKKKGDIICYMLVSLVSLQQENFKKFEKSMKMANIEGEILHMF